MHAHEARGVRAIERAERYGDGVHAVLLRCEGRDAPPRVPPSPPSHGHRLDARSRALARESEEAELLAGLKRREFALRSSAARVRFLPSLFRCAARIQKTTPVRAREIARAALSGEKMTPRDYHVGERRRDCVAPGDCHQAIVIVFL